MYAIRSYYAPMRYILNSLLYIMFTGCYGPRLASHYHRKIKVCPMPDVITSYSIHYTKLYEGGWNENIYSQTLKSNIVSTVITSSNISKLAEFKVYPNPTSGLVYIQTEAPDFGFWPVSVYTMNGTLVYRNQIHIDNNVLSVDLSGLSSGIYWKLPGLSTAWIIYPSV